MKNWLVFTVGLTLFIASVLYFKPLVRTQEIASAQPAVAGARTERTTEETPILKEINITRSLDGLQNLQSDRVLDTIARKRASDMVAQGKYSHVMSDGSFYDSLLEKVGITSGYSCENLDLITDETGDIAVADWLASTAGHKDCMLNSKTEFIGLSVMPFGVIDTNGKSQMHYIVVAISSQFTVQIQ